METINISQFFADIRKVLRTYTDFQTDALDKFDLSPNEIAVLSSIGSYNTASEIASCSNVSKALVSRSVKSLKAKGYLITNISSVDKREQMLVLTEGGQKVADCIFDVYKRFYSIAFNDFSNDEMTVLNALLKLVLKNLSAGDIDGRT